MKSKGTRIVIKALTPEGVAVLMSNMLDEIALRNRWAGVVKKFIPLNVRAYLLTVSAYVPKEAPVEHHITGFGVMDDRSRRSFYLGVKKTFKDAGCSLKDFEVSFVDE